MAREDFTTPRPCKSRGPLSPELTSVASIRTRSVSSWVQQRGSRLFATWIPTGVQGLVAMEFLIDTSSTSTHYFPGAWVGEVFGRFCGDAVVVAHGGEISVWAGKVWRRMQRSR